MERILGKEQYIDSINKIMIGEHLKEEEAYRSLKQIYDINDEVKRTSLMVSILFGSMVNKPSIYEVRGFIRASLEIDGILNNKKEIDLDGKLIGLSGSGKKGFKTFNISTPSAIVACSLGAYVAKACSQSTSSKTGSSDFLEMVGININLENQKKEDCLRKYGLIFYSIEETTPKFASLYGGKFYAPHSMSYCLAALSFPIKVDVNLYGLSNSNTRLSVELLKSFNVKNAIVYSSTSDKTHYLDEIGVDGQLIYSKLEDGEIIPEKKIDIQKTFKFLGENSIENILEKQDKIENVAIAVKALKGIGSKDAINVICVNASLILLASGIVENLLDGYHKSMGAIKSGIAYSRFCDIVKAYGGNLNDIEEKYLK
ncbi:MAG: hypothetical protein K6G28_04705 [Acholeplasmatales bacterium]|nr:hypothetical protein [Acholeplasmatales bacterium]